MIYERLRIMALTLCLILFGTMQAHRLDYRELQELGVACPQQDSCRWSRNVPKTSPNPMSCECDPLCGRRGTCCIDSRFLTLSRKPVEKCESVYFPYDRDIFMVTQCASGLSHDPHTKSQCENQMGWSREDPLRDIPVTNPASQITYKNYFCAQCNENRGDLIPWNLVVKAYFRPEEAKLLDRDAFFDNLEFNDTMYGWAYRLKNATHGDRFVGMDFGTYPPENIRHLIKQCSFIAQASCSEGWVDTEVKSKCESYMALVNLVDNHGYSRVFRNVHCAICQNYTIKDSSCIALSSHIPDRPLDISGGPIAETFDVSLSEGNRVGRVKCCGAGKVIDPFNSSRSESSSSCPGVKCRQVSCARRGYVIRNFRCVSSR